MTLEEAAKTLEDVRTGWALVNGPVLGPPIDPEHDRVRLKFDEVYRLAAAVLRAFPKMLEALEAEDAIRFTTSSHDAGGGVTHRWAGDGAETGCRKCLGDKMRKEALRAAREALGPVTPPRRCADSVTEWQCMEGQPDALAERTVPCNHPLPCPLHTPRAAREAVKP